jgi:tetratricopeptide (TPR) repeat protein
MKIFLSPYRASRIQWLARLFWPWVVFQFSILAVAQGTGEWDGVMSPEAEQHHRLGVAAMSRSDWKEALKELRTALKYTRKAVPVYNSLGEVNLAMGETDRAITNFRIAIALGPLFAPAYANMGRALARRKDWAGAKDFYSAALRLQPDWPEVRSLLAGLPSASGQLPPATSQLPPEASQSLPACAEWKKAMETNASNWTARHQCGRALLASGEAAAALAEFERVVAARPQDAVALYNKGRALLKLKRAAEAEAAFTKARELDPTLPPPPR